MRISDWSSDVCSSDLECFRAHTNHRSHNHDLQQGCERLEVRVVYGSIDALLHATNSAWQRCDQPSEHHRLSSRRRQPRSQERRQLSQPHRSEEHTSELQSLMRLSYAVFCLKKKNKYLTT